MPFSRRCSPCGRGFTVVEALVGCVILLLVMGVSYGMFLWTWRGFLKGDDTLTSVYDASVLLLTLRRDVLRMEFPDGQANDIVFTRTGSNAQTSALDYRWSTGQLVPSTAAPAAPAASSTESMQLWFVQRWGADVKPVSYTYYPASRTVKREGGREGETKYFSMPRLQSFEVQLGLQPRGSAAALYHPATSIGAGVEPTQIWMQAQIRVQSDRKAGESEKTAIEVSTLIFPKRLNGLLRARWGR